MKEWVVFLLLISGFALSQPDSLYIIKSRKLKNIFEGNKRIQILTGDVLLGYKKTLFSGENVFIYEDRAIAQDNIKIIFNDSVKISADTLYYDRIKNYADVYGNCSLETPSYYMLSSKGSCFIDSALIILPVNVTITGRKVKEKITASYVTIKTSPEIIIYMFGNVRYSGEEISWVSDTAIFQPDSGKAYITGKGLLFKKNDTMIFSRLIIDKRSNSIIAEGCPTIKTGGKKITGETIKVHGDTISIKNGNILSVEGENTECISSPILSVNTRSEEIRSDSETIITMYGRAGEDTTFLIAHNFIGKRDTAIFINAILHRKDLYIRGDTLKWLKGDTSANVFVSGSSTIWQLRPDNDTSTFIASQRFMITFKGNEPHSLISPDTTLLKARDSLTEYNVKSSMASLDIDSGKISRAIFKNGEINMKTESTIVHSTFSEMEFKNDRIILKKNIKGKALIPRKNEK